MKSIQRVISLGPKRALIWLRTRIGKKIAHLAHLPLWLAFKVRHTASPAIDTLADDPRGRKEDRICEILARIPGGKFLEVGIGEFPRAERFALMRDMDISYVGCDFESVCKSHEVELALKEIDQTRIRFAPNSTGTYAWTLFEMLKSGEQYEVIYIDGHHTFYIDLPAILLADRLLKPGGYLLLDDMQWTLSFLKANLKRSLSQWHFYRKIYNFSEYTEHQQSVPHIRMIAEELFLKDSRYAKDESLSLKQWWALQKAE
ncbi:hypothetical protein JNK62_02560 [bacterium]|nr:hypothetical protein [bacterium]